MNTVALTCFTIALLISPGNLPCTSSHESDVEQTASEQSQKFIPSPFAVAPHLTAVPELAEPGEHTVENEKYAGSKKIKFRSYFLNVDDATRKQILKITGSENLATTSGEIAYDWQPQLPLTGDETFEQNRNYADDRKPELKKHAVQFGQITQGTFEQIESIVKANSDNQLAESSAVAHENQMGSVLDGTIKPFLVSVQHEVEETTVLQRRIVQNLEDGFIMRQKAKILQDAMQIEIHMISNTITTVDTFTFDGSAADPVTIQLPICDCAQAKCVSRLKYGHVLLIDSNIRDEKSLNRMIVVSAEVVE